MVYNQLLEYVGNVVLLENAIAQQKDVLQKINARCEDLGKLGKPMNINTSLHIFSNISGCLFLSIIVEVIGLDTVDNSQINVLTQRTMHRICTAATNEEVSFAYRVAIPRQRFRWRNAFSTRWRSL